jgi:hypothetical protein
VILPIETDLKNYMNAFGIAALVRYRDGRVGVSRGPQRAEAAFWLPADRAGDVFLLAPWNGGDILAAAEVLGVHLTEHHQMIARSRAAVERLDERLARAKADGLLRFFNADYGGGGSQPASKGMAS